MPEKILFVCTGNIDRSPTAEDLLADRENYEVKSAGTHVHARRRVSKNILDWADIIFVMERAHEAAILQLHACSSWAHRFTPPLINLL